MQKGLLYILLLITVQAFSQTAINPAKIDIVRDNWGVPHIFGKTDPEVAYGLAWAHAEDDFKTLQTAFLAGKAMLGLYKGKSGATIDYIVQLLRTQEVVNARYETDISPAYKKLLEAYCDGINAYAKKHPKEVLVKQLFPLTPKDMTSYSILQLCIACGAGDALQKIFGGKMPASLVPTGGGSNAYAFNSKVTKDGSTYLGINSHQPLEGPVSWYEAHLCSEEGWNIIGALFAGAPSILSGCNEYLGWAHTVNYPDKLDVYQLEINPNNKLQYKFDGAWIPLEVATASMRVRVAGIPITVKKKTYQSKYGPTVITKQGTFSIRLGPLHDIGALEEWYLLNKARNFTEFKKILDKGAIPGYNLVYADRYDTIYYLSNGKIPIRDPAFNWKATLPGNTSKTLWTNYHPIDDLPQVLNPASGYLFNSNHSPFNATAAADNIRAGNYDATMGYETLNNNRSIRFMELMAQYGTISYEDFKTIKYDRQLPANFAYPVAPDSIFLLDTNAYPDIAAIITTLQQWDHQAQATSKGAAYFTILYYYVVQQLAGNWKGTYRLSTPQSVQTLRYVKAYLLKHFNSTDITLGDYQRLVRGDKNIPLPGLPDVIASMESAPYKDGRVRGKQGECYIELVRFTANGPEIESINAYGASSKKDSPHYADQMEWFTQQKTKKMYLDKKKVYATAVRVYHPE
jgi:acyl-homoserine-lactone acylase